MKKLNIEHWKKKVKKGLFIILFMLKLRLFTLEVLMINSVVFVSIYLFIA